MVGVCRGLRGDCRAAGTIRICAILHTVSGIARGSELLASRPDLLDRNGQVLATDIRTVSLYAMPHKITDPDEVIERLSTVLPGLDVRSGLSQVEIESRSFSGCAAS